MTSVFNSRRLFWSPSPTPTDRTHTHSRTSLMSCVAPCTCTTKICLGDEIQAPLVCAICKSPTKLTVCDTNSDGFVCGNEDCKYMNRMLGDMLDMEVIRIIPIDFIISIVRDPLTGKLQIKDSDENLPTPEELAFNFLEQHDLLVRPDHQQVITMSFQDLTHPRNYDGPIDTIYLKTTKPLEYSVGKEGSTNSYCHKWKCTCLPGGNLKMCSKIPVKTDGRCRIMMEFCDMQRIL